MRRACGGKSSRWGQHGPLDGGGAAPKSYDEKKGRVGDEAGNRTQAAAQSLYSSKRHSIPSASPCPLSTEGQLGSQHATSHSSHERGGVGAGAGIVCVLLVAGLVVPGLVHQDQRLQRVKGMRASDKAAIVLLVVPVLAQQE